jgi:hypothetical protein
MQKGPLWWADHHVNHHRYADRDVRSAQPCGQRLLTTSGGSDDAKHDQLGRAIQSCVISQGAEIALLERFFFIPPRSPSRSFSSAGFRSHLGFLLADDDAGSLDVCDQHGQSSVRFAPVRHAR